MSTQFQIEKNIPIPPKIRGHAGEVAAVLGSMDVGDSFVFDDDKTKSTQRSLHYAAKRRGVKIAVRVVGERRYRAWRVE